MMRSATAKYAATILTSLTLGVTGVVFFSPSDGGNSASRAPEQAALAPSANDTPREAPAPAIPMRQWKEGQTFVYELDTNRGMTFASQNNVQQTSQYQMVGKLMLTVVGRDGDVLRMRADVEPARVDVTPASDKDAKKLFSATFYFQSSSNGEIKAFLFPKEVAVDARILLKGLVNSFQMVVPPPRTAKWHVTEADVTGRYHASYEATTASTIEKSKTRYVSSRSASGFAPLHKGTHYAVESSVTFGLHESGWPQRLIEKETAEISLGVNRAKGHIETKANLVRVETHPEWVGAFPKNLESDTMSEAAARAMAMKQADINLIGGRSLAMIAADLKGDDKHARNQAQARMAALMRVDPGQAAKALEEVLHGDGDKESKKRLIGAMGSAGTPEAQHALAQLLGDQSAADKRIDAAIALSRTKNATEETARALQEASSSSEVNVKNTAILASGNVVRTMNAEGTGDTADAVQRLIDGLANAQTDSQRQVYLDAIGNSGDPRVLAAVTPYLAHTNDVLRAAAVGALKFMVVPEADALIIAAMGDTALPVRKAAAHTIAFRPIAGVIEAVDALLKTETEMAIRTEILKGLNVKLAEDAGVIDIVMWAMENDPSSTVRAFAKEIVDGYNLDKI